MPTRTYWFTSPHTEVEGNQRISLWKAKTHAMVSLSFAVCPLYGVPSRLVVQSPTGIHYQLLKMFTELSFIASPEILADNICTCHAYRTDAYTKCVVSCLHQMCITWFVYRCGEGMVHSLGAKPVTEIWDNVSTFAKNFQLWFLCWHETDIIVEKSGHVRLCFCQQNQLF